MLNNQLEQFEISTLELSNLGILGLVFLGIGTFGYFSYKYFYPAPAPAPDLDPANLTDLADKVKTVFEYIPASDPANIVLEVLSSVVAAPAVQVAVVASSLLYINSLSSFQIFRSNVSYMKYMESHYKPNWFALAEIKMKLISDKESILLVYILNKLATDLPKDYPTNHPNLIERDNLTTAWWMTKCLNFYGNFYRNQGGFRPTLNIVRLLLADNNEEVVKLLIVSRYLYAFL